MKFRGHETFSIRKGWLNKGIRAVTDKPDVFISKTENPMDVFGIGANMVKSLRYWLQAAGLTYEAKGKPKIQALTEIGRIIYENDPYFEEIGSLWLVHYALAKNRNNAAAWYLFFNEFDYLEFSEEEFYHSVRKYMTMQGDLPSDRSINDDYKCIINTYCSRKSVSSSEQKINPEDNLECPLTELGLIEYVTSKKSVRVYKKTVPKEENLPILIILAMILDKYPSGGEVRISALQNEKNSIGKICCLDTISLLNILYQLEKEGFLKVTRTAGLDVVTIRTELTFTACVREYYKELNNR